MQRIDYLKIWIVVLMGVLLFACATFQDVHILDKEMDRLHSEVTTLKKEQDSNRNEWSALRKEWSVLPKEWSALKNEWSALRKEQSAENQKFKADLLLRFENLQSEFRIFSTSLEEYKEFLKKPSKEIDRLRDDVFTRTRLLEEKVKIFGERTRTLEDRPRALEERARGAEERTKGIEERTRGVEERTKGIEERTRRVEERTRGIEEYLKGVEERLKGLDGKIDKLALKQAESEKPVVPKETPQEIKGVGVSAGAGDLYKDAYETLQRGDLEGARRKFEAFLKQYPNIELSDNAQFWIGETYFLKKDFEKAILEYEKTIAKYPEGDKISAALLKQALAFLEIGDKSTARNLLRRVIERYPHSDQAEMAKKRLEGIK
ncbi:MAG: tol-pal system protein YbgF [Deltaproteobacteria bacterium RBG_13_47_9]|nr:MAG: tol-pal system protein YbgF [Deltaproteobacteria bacterium RBG_13_47_9]